MSIEPPVRLPDPHPQYDQRTANVTRAQLTAWFEKLWKGDHVVNGKLTTKSARILKVTSVTSEAYTILLTDDVIDVNRDGTVSLTLPLNPADGQRWIVQDSSGNASGNTITINKSAAKNVNGTTAVTITTDYGRLTIVYNGAEFIAA